MFLTLHNIFSSMAGSFYNLTHINFFFSFNPFLTTPKQRIASILEAHWLVRFRWFSIFATSRQLWIFFTLGLTYFLCLFVIDVLLFSASFFLLESLGILSESMGKCSFYNKIRIFSINRKTYDYYLIPHCNLVL